MVLDPTAPAVTQTFHTPVGPLAYTDVGTGPPLVFLHGNPTSARLYRHLLRELAPDYRCIAPDYLGFGRSAAPRAFSYRPSAHATLVETLLRDLDLSEITLVLHDWGGPIGLAYALRHPDTVRRLVLMNTWAAPPWSGSTRSPGSSCPRRPAPAPPSGRTGSGPTPQPWTPEPAAMRAGRSPGRSGRKPRGSGRCGRAGIGCGTAPRCCAGAWPILHLAPRRASGAGRGSSLTPRSIGFPVLATTCRRRKGRPLSDPFDSFFAPSPPDGPESGAAATRSGSVRSEVLHALPLDH